MYKSGSISQLQETTVIAVRSLLRYKLRSFLTMLGIIFGIAAVISMMAMGAGAREEILLEIQKLGINNIIINSIKPPESENASETSKAFLTYGLTSRDSKQIQDTVAPVERIMEVHSKEVTVWQGSKKIEARMRGIMPEAFDLLNLRITQGRPLCALDSIERRRVALINNDMLKKLAFLGDPTTLELMVDTDFYNIVGVIQSQEFTSPTSKALDVEQNFPELYVPFATSMGRYGTFSFTRKSGTFDAKEIELEQLVIRVGSTDKVFSAARMIQAILKKFHEDVQDYEIIVPLELLHQSEKTQNVFNIVMILIASISLLVGGIGIVNIMLATITERTKEIGIRRALGATQSDITFQFLVETVVLSSIGGLFGVLLGVGGVYAMSYFTSWNALISWESVTISLVISCSVGIIFGIYPARRAAAMDPITALRHE